MDQIIDSPPPQQVDPIRAILLEQEEASRRAREEAVAETRAALHRMALRTKEDEEKDKERNEERDEEKVQEKDQERDEVREENEKREEVEIGMEEKGCKGVNEGENGDRMNVVNEEGEKSGLNGENGDRINGIEELGEDSRVEEIREELLEAIRRRREEIEGSAKVLDWEEILSAVGLLPSGSLPL